MKNNAKYLFCLPVIFLLAGAFVKPSHSIATPDTYRPEGGVYILFAGKYEGKITKTEIDGQTELRVEGCHKDARISGFSLLITQRGKTTTLTSDSKTLTLEMRYKLKNLNKGDQFEFKNTRAYIPGHKEVAEVLGGRFIVA